MNDQEKLYKAVEMLVDSEWIVNNEAMNDFLKSVLKFESNQKTD
jgi:hypothetical protein